MPTEEKNARNLKANCRQADSRAALLRANCDQNDGRLRNARRWVELASVDPEAVRSDLGDEGFMLLVGLLAAKVRADLLLRDYEEVREEADALLHASARGEQA